MQTSVLSGIASGKFTNLQVLNSTTGLFEDVLPGVNSGGGGGVSLAQVQSEISSSLQPYLTGAQTQLSIDSTIATELASYTDTTGLNTLLASYTDTTGLNTLLANYVLTSALLQNYRTTTDTNTYIAGQLVNKIDTLVAGTGIALSGSQNNRNIAVDTSTIATVAYVQQNFLSPLTNPVSFTVGSGLTANLTANTVALSLNFSEVRPQISLNSGTSFRDLTSNSNHELLWDSQPVALQSFVDLSKTPSHLLRQLMLET